MKCNVFVKYEPRGKNKKLKITKRVLEPQRRLWHKLNPPGTGQRTPPPQFNLEPGMVRCDGNVKVSIRAICSESYGDYDSPGNDCCPELDVEFKCDKCGNTCYPELPKYDLDALFQKILDSVGFIDRDKLVAEYVEREIAKYNQMQEWAKKQEADGLLPPKKKPRKRTTKKGRKS